MNSLRISGDLPELHLDLQINHEAGKALVSLADADTLGPVSGLLQRLNHSQPPRGSAWIERQSLPDSMAQFLGIGHPLCPCPSLPAWHHGSWLL